jgi:hypothetical protein
MRFPWLQVDADFIAAHAGDLAGYLGISRREAMGLALDLWTWVLARSPANRPPDGVVTGADVAGFSPEPARIVAVAVGWVGDPAALCGALSACGMLEIIPNGVRIRGMSRYARTWEKNNRRRTGDNNAGNRRGTGEKPAPKTQTQTQTQIEEETTLSESSVDEGEKPADLRSLWNAEADPRLPRWRELTPKRSQQAAARLREHPLAEWRIILDRINASPFCLGQNDRGWKADVEFFLRPDTATRVLEGKYDPKPGQGPSQAIPKADDPGWVVA